MAWDELTDYEKGYIAAFLDGEGSISVTKHNTVGYQLRVSFYNTHKETMDWIAKAIEEQNILRSVDKRRRDIQTKDNYAIQISKQSSLLTFLVQVKPYLKIKREQAELGLKFMDIVLNRSNRKYSPEDKVKMKEIYYNISKLNKGCN